MAKSKPIPKAEPKKFVSTSAMFKHASRDKSRKGKPRKTCFNVKKKGVKDRHTSAVRKSKKTPDHPLAVAFTCIVSNIEQE